MRRHVLNTLIKPSVLTKTHSRDIYVKFFEHRIEYDIPVYDDTRCNYFKLEQGEYSMTLTLFQLPDEFIPIENPLVESETCRTRTELKLQ